MRLSGNLKLDRVGDAAVRIAILQASRSGGMSITTPVWPTSDQLISDQDISVRPDPRRANLTITGQYDGQK